MKKANSHISLSELSRVSGIDRGRVAKLLEDLPFKVGAGGAHLYDRAKAIGRVKGYGRDMQQMRELRLEKLQAEAELAKQKVADYSQTHIPLEAHDFFWKHMSAAWWRFVKTLELPFPQEVEAGHNLVFEQIAAWRQMGMPKDRIEREERELGRARAALTKAIKDGVMRDNWMEVPLEVREAICVRKLEEEK